MSKEVTVFVKYTGTVPDDASIADIKSEMDYNLEHSVRLNFPTVNEDDGDPREAWLEREDTYVTGHGYTLIL